MEQYRDLVGAGSGQGGGDDKGGGGGEACSWGHAAVNEDLHAHGCVTLATGLKGSLVAALLGHVTCVVGGLVVKRRRRTTIEQTLRALPGSTGTT